MKTIPLNRGLVALVDDEDYEFVQAYKWYALKPHRSSTHYAVRNVGRGVVAYMHRDLLGAEKGQFVDHANRDGLDNRRQNIRLCSRGQNNTNRIYRNRHYCRGVYQQRNGKWRARITQGGTTRYLGVFLEQKDAALEYDKAARELHGPFAVVNFSVEANG